MEEPLAGHQFTPCRFPRPATQVADGVAGERQQVQRGQHGGKLLLAGLLLGVALAIAASQAITKLLYGLSPSDPLTIVLSVLLLALVALPASLIPAFRASRLDPMQALREE